MTLLHAAADEIVSRCDVTLGFSPSESQVRRAAAARFGLEPTAGIQIFRGQSMIDKDFVPMPTSGSDAGMHSWHGMKWDAHPYLVVTTTMETDQVGQWKWMKSAVSHAMTVRILFTELNEPMDGDKEEPVAEGRGKCDNHPDISGGDNGGPAFATHALLFDARQTTDDLKKGMAAVLNQSQVGAWSSESEPLQQLRVDPSNFNALLKVGVKETVLNRPTAPPFKLARFRSGFSRLPCCIPLRLVRGRAADLRTRMLALRWHMPGEPVIYCCRVCIRLSPPAVFGEANSAQTHSSCLCQRRYGDVFARIAMRWAFLVEFNVLCAFQKNVRCGQHR